MILGKDKERLKSLVSSQGNTALQCVYNTLIGAFIVYLPKDVTIELFYDSCNYGVIVRHIEYDYVKSEFSNSDLRLVDSDWESYRESIL